MATVQELIERFIDAVAKGELTVDELFAKEPASPEFLGQAWRFVLTMLRERHVSKNLVRAIEILCAQDPGFVDGSFVLGMANYNLGRMSAAKTAFERHIADNGPRTAAARGMIANIDNLRSAA